MQYGQFCPIAKATEILGERWTILILRELLMGGRRFSELRRGLGDISPALLVSRLKTLEEVGIVARRRISGQRGHDYHPTAACEGLRPVVMAIGEWGLSFARHLLVEDDFDFDFLMFYLERSVDPKQLPGDETVVQFRFTDLIGLPEIHELEKRFGTPRPRAEACPADRRRSRAGGDPQVG